MNRMQLELDLFKRLEDSLQRNAKLKIIQIILVWNLEKEKRRMSFV